MKRQNNIPATIKEITGLQAVRESGRGQSWYVLKNPPGEEYVHVCGNLELINRYIEMFKTSGILDVYRLERTYTVGSYTGRKEGYLFVVLNKSGDVIGSFMYTEPGFATYNGRLVLNSKYHDKHKLEDILKELREKGTAIKL